MKSYIRAFLQVATILIIGLVSIWAVSLFTRDKSKEDIIKEIVKEVIIKRPICPDTFESFAYLKNSGQVVTLVRHLNSYGIQGDGFVNSKSGILKISGSGSQVACGYIYIQTHVGDRPIQSWENPYIKLGEFGGHIIRETAIIDREKDAKTESLFNLGKMVYVKGDGITEKSSVDWAALFNVANRIGFIVALNTSDNRGVIDEVSIVYKCWNPETGNETADCKLTAE